MSEVATKKLFENERTIVWEMTLQPGESTGVHTHEHDYFFHVLTGSTLETTSADGQPLGTSDVEAGSTYYLTLEGNELVIGNIRVPARHDAKNVGSSTYSEILVEFK